MVTNYASLSFLHFFGELQYTSICFFFPFRRLGDFFSYNRGCPQGWMQITERDRPYSDGYWCGDSRGFNIYYSETETVTLTLKQFIPMEEYIHFSVSTKHLLFKYQTIVPNISFDLNKNLMTGLCV